MCNCYSGKIIFIGCFLLIKICCRWLAVHFNLLLLLCIFPQVCIFFNSIVLMSGSYSKAQVEAMMFNKFSGSTKVD